MSLSEPERSSRTEILQRQSEALQNLLQAISGTNAFWTEKFEAVGIEAASIQAPEDLRQLPMTTKADLIADQLSHPPYGTNLTYDLHKYVRLHQTSGTTDAPLRWLDTAADWNWFMQCWAQIFRIMGLKPHDRFAFPFSFGPFIGFWAGFEAAASLGHLSLAGGGMSSLARLRMIAENGATIVCCTPTYAMRLAEVAAEEKIDLQSGPVRALIVAGEPGGCIDATRSRIESSWGARLFDHWGMTEIGALAVECVESPGGIHVLETECIAEIIDPDSGDPTHPGDVGELVITNLGRRGSPLIRYRTGDRVIAETNACQCGRELLRLQGGILGRADEMLTIRGNNVFPSSLESILRRFDDVAEYRVEIGIKRSMEHLQIQIEPTQETEAAHKVDRLVSDVSKAIKSRLNFEAEVVAVPSGTLPRFELKGRRFVRRALE